VLALFALGCLLGLFACTVGGHIGSGSVLQQDWDKRRGPVIPHDNFPKDCSLCHEGGTWSKIREDFRFDHLKETGVELSGAHAHAECLRCHNDRGPVGLFAQRGCAGCHEDVHRGKQGNECTSCHSQNSWSIGDALALHARTRFPLYGMHASIECWRCHPGAQVANFDRAAVQCENCHQSDLATATNPDHHAQGWTSGCEHCHSTASWSGADFNHSWWSLTGAHAVPPRACTDCHANANYVGTASTCIGCHQSAYDGTTNPSHVQGNFPTSCQACHSTSHWQPATFSHAGVGFPLDGAHLTLSCAQCHADYSVTLPTACVGCHQHDYDASTAPNHGQLGLSTACANCHTTHAGWAPAHMDHTGLSSTCQECHLPDYNATTNPDHAALGFPVECAVCHTSTTNWSAVHWQHSQFPQHHAGSQCDQCHTTPQVYTAFSCISGGCHPQSSTDNHHDHVNHYQYNSAACYDCHPNGQGGDDLRGGTGRRGAHPAPLIPTRAQPGRRAPPRRIPGSASTPNAPPAPPAVRRP